MKILLICVLLLLCYQTFGNSNQHVNIGELNAYNYDVVGKDFQNTQTNKLCLLARLNATISFSYK